MPPRNLPFPPMEAELVEELPAGDWQYEPKWDGFRGVLENLRGELHLWSRNGRPLLRYFPELAEVGALLPPESALDGEIIISREGKLEFDQLQLRLHPAESRIKRLSAEIPADYVAFDVLVWKGKPFHELPLEKRRRELEQKGSKFRLSPATRDPKQAAKWLDRLEQAGLDDEKGSLDFVGHCSGFPAPVRRELEAELPKTLAPGKLSDKRIPGGQSRWSRGKELDWNPVRPELVIEVRFDKLEGNRFRHGTKFIRFRPDKDPAQCTWDQVRPKRRRGDPTVEKLLAR